AAVVIGTDAPSYDIHAALRPDAWEDWSVARDRRWDEARSARYVSRDVIGYEDLDDYGEWRDTGPYGAVWVPRSMMVGWAPYPFGHWAWVDPWDGRGLTTHRGASRRFITGAGCTWTAGGDGCRAA